MMSRKLWKTEKSSIVHRTESVSMIHHRQSVVVSSTAADQTQRNFFFRILPVWFLELPGRRVLHSKYFYLVQIEIYLIQIKKIYFKI